MSATFPRLSGAVLIPPGVGRLKNALSRPAGNDPATSSGNTRKFPSAAVTFIPCTASRFAPFTSPGSAAVTLNAVATVDASPGRAALATPFHTVPAGAFASPIITPFNHARNPSL